jgi:hypothetical protein
MSQQQSNMLCLSTVFLQAKALVATLQSAAVSSQHRSKASERPALQARVQLAGILRVLQQLHSLTTETLIQLKLPQPSEQQKDSSSTVGATPTSVCSICGCWHCCAALSEQELQDAAAQLEQGLQDWMNSVPEHIRDITSSEKASGEHCCMCVVIPTAVTACLEAAVVPSPAEGVLVNRLQVPLHSLLVNSCRGLLAAAAAAAAASLLPANQTARHFAAARQQQLIAEAAANMAAAQAAQLPAHACAALQAVVGRLRTIESCVLFQAQLLQQAAAVSAGTGYSSSNFAYSSTPFSSWLKVTVVCH